MGTWCWCSIMQQLLAKPRHWEGICLLMADRGNPALSMNRLKLHRSKSTNKTHMRKSPRTVPCTYRLRPNRTMLPYVIIFVYVAVSGDNSRLELLVIHDCLLPLRHWLKEIPTAVKKFSNPWAGSLTAQEPCTVVHVMPSPLSQQHMTNPLVTEHPSTIPNKMLNWVQKLKITVCWDVMSHSMERGTNALEEPHASLFRTKVVWELPACRRNLSTLMTQRRESQSHCGHR